jgi:replicative DNA helicase
MSPSGSDQSHIAVVEGDPEELPTYRSLPHNIEAEQALLGAILVNNEAANRVSGFLRPEHFFEPVHGRIYEAAWKLIERGQLATPVTLKAFFEHDAALDEIGGAQYLARLAGSAVTIIDAEHYGRVIHDLSLRRELIQIGEDVVNTAFTPSVDETAMEQIEQTEQQLFHLAESGSLEGGFQSFARSLDDAVRAAEAAYKRETPLTGVATELRDLDAKLGGLHRSDLVVLAGRPSMGKTALATNIAFTAARARHRAHQEAAGGEAGGEIVDGAVVGFFSLEMSAEQLATRVLGEQAGIPSEKLRRGELGPDDFVRVVKVSQELEAIPFFIDDTPALTITALRTRARRLKRTQGLSLVVVDYLQLLRPSGRSRQDSRVLEISEITQGLKALAKELSVPVLALSQLSRAVEQRDDKRPLLSDLRESGAIEQDADAVLFIFREEYYLERRQPRPDTPEHEKWLADMERAHNVAELIIGKNRHGPTSTVKLLFEGATTRFRDLDAADHLPDMVF